MPDDKTPSTPLTYGLDDRPPWIRTLFYGLQWLIMFLPVLTVLSAVAADLLGLEGLERIHYFQRLLFITGATMILQTLWGHRLPLLDGPASALVITLAVLASSGPAVISGGLLFGGLLVFILGVSGTMRYLAPLFTERVNGVILLLIGLTILPYILPMILGISPRRPDGSPAILALALGLIVLMSAMFHYLKGLLQSLTIFFGVIIGCIIFAVLGEIDPAAVKQAPWFSMPDLSTVKRPVFDLGAVLSFALAYLAVLVNTTGSLFSIEQIVAADKIEKRLNRSLILTGLSGIVSGVGGVFGTVPYSMSPGVIVVTRVGSRFTVTACGILMLCLTFFGKLTALLSSIPGAVIGAALLVSMAAGAGVSIDLIQRSGKMTSREYLVIGLPVLLGVGVTLTPTSFLNLLPQAIKPIVGNGLVVGVITVLLLEHLILRKRKNRD